MKYIMIGGSVLTKRLLWVSMSSSDVCEYHIYMTLYAAVAGVELICDSGPNSYRCMM